MKRLLIRGFMMRVRGVVMRMMMRMGSLSVGGFMMTFFESLVPNESDLMKGGRIIEEGEKMNER
jgi:hypothetical protein